MKSVYDKKRKSFIATPETEMEAVKQLQTFLQSDMWYAQEEEWKTEKDMLKYLDGHFSICKKQIKKIQKK